MHAASQDDLTILTWKDVKDQVIALNPVIGERLDQLKGVNDFPVIRARYPFGSHIIQDGHFYLPSESGSSLFSFESAPKPVHDALNYHWQTIPFGIITENSFESHLKAPTHTIPLRLLRPGHSFSLLTIFEDPDNSHFIPSIYNAIAGCRSLVTLSQLAHKEYSKRLTKRFGITEHLNPKNLSQQWYLFKELAEATREQNHWYTEVLYFSKPFISAIQQESGLKEKLLTFAWQRTSYNRSLPAYDLIWSLLINQLPLSIRNNHTVIETVKHLTALGLQEILPGYIPATNTIAGPITDLTEAIANVYRLRYFLPIFMHITEYDGQSPVYYSLHKPTFIHAIPQKTAANQTINDIQNIRNTLQHFKEQILTDQLPFSLKDSKLYQMFKNVQFDFYHPKATDCEGIISDTQQIADEDKRFMTMAETAEINLDKNGQFPIYSHFFHGCIRLKPAQ